MSISSASEISLLSNEPDDDVDCEERVDSEHDDEQSADINCEERIEQSADINCEERIEQSADINCEERIEQSADINCEERIEQSADINCEERIEQSADINCEERIEQSADINCEERIEQSADINCEERIEQSADINCEERIEQSADINCEERIEQSADLNCEESCVNDRSAIVSSASTLLKWLGFKIVIDNIDKNLRRSFQRFNNKTISMHACHMYACLDRIDFSSLSDVMPSDPLIDVETLLIGKAEINELNGDVEVLLERYVICDVDNIILV